MAGWIPQLFAGGLGVPSRVPPPSDLPGLGGAPGMGPDPLAGLAPSPLGNFAPYTSPDLSPDSGVAPVPYTPQQTGAPMALGNLLGGLYGGENPGVEAVGQQMQNERDAERAARPLDVPDYGREDEDEQDDADLFKPHGVKQTLIERGIPALIAALAGAFGGGSAAATGMLAGSSKGLEQQRAEELEQAKIESARRDRKRARTDANQQRQWQRLQDRASATNSLMSRLREFEDPQAGLTWLRSTSTRQTYAALGIDVDDIGGALAPEMEAKLRTEARERYTKTLTNLQARYKDKDLPPSVLDEVAIKFHGVDMTLRELADYGGEGALGKDAEMKLAPQHPGTFEAQIEGAFKTFEENTGRPPDVKEQGNIVLAERKKWMESGRDPATAQLTQLLLQGRVDAQAETRRSEGEMARHYTKPQLQLMVQLENQYNKQAAPFAAKARFFNEIRDTTPRALRKGDTPGSPIAQTRMIFQYMKMLDEDSAVRASEQEQVRNARGIPDYVLDWYWQARHGQVLNNDIILQILQEATKTYDTAKGQHYQYALSLAEQADAFDIDVNDVIRDYNAYGDPMGGPNDKGWPYKRRERVDRGNRRTDVPGAAAPPAEAAPDAAPATPGATPSVVPGGRIPAANEPTLDFGTAGRSAPGGPLSPSEIRAGGARPGTKVIEGVPGGARGLPGAAPTGGKAVTRTGPTVAPTAKNVQVGRIVVAHDGSEHVITGVPASGGGVQARRVKKVGGRYVYADGGPDDGQPVPGH
jgi:hypothetical protein